LQEFSLFYFKLLSCVTKISVSTDIIVLCCALCVLKCVLLAVLVTYENNFNLNPSILLCGCFVQTAISDQGWRVTYCVSEQNNSLSELRLL
jgi:hypothetical protein